MYLNLKWKRQKGCIAIPKFLNMYFSQIFCLSKFSFPILISFNLDRPDHIRNNSIVISVWYWKLTTTKYWHLSPFPSWNIAINDDFRVNIYFRVVWCFKYPSWTLHTFQWLRNWFKYYCQCPLHNARHTISGEKELEHIEGKVAVTSRMTLLWMTH